ncbi:MAG: hypothetical protein FD126_2233, partial [Elusimicrobia bacterium]
EGSARHGMQYRLDVGGLGAAHFKSDTTYYFRLAAVDSGLARSSWSLESSTYVFRAVPPSGRAVTEVSTHSLSVAFGTASASAHLVEASTAADFTGVLARFTTSDPSVVVATLTTLAPNTTYFVRAGTLWRTATAYAFAVPGSTATDPAAPLTAVSTFPVVDSASMTVVWDGAGNPLGLTTYTVVLATSNFFPTSGTMTVTATTAPAGGTSATLFGLKDLTTYYLFVRAVGHSGTASTYTALGSTVTPPDLEPPASITDLRVTSAALTGLFVDLSWSAPGDDGLMNPLDSAEYRIDYATYAVAFATTGAEVVQATSSVTPGDRQYLRIASLNGGSTYYFRVFARDNSGNWSALSNGATVFLRWSSDTVAAGRAQVTGIAGPDGTQHLFFNDGATSFKHASRLGDAPWTVEDVTTGLANVGVRSSAVVDSSGTIHVVYTFSSPANQVRYKSWAGAWSAQETVFTGAGGAFETVSMGVGADGRVHAAFVGGAATELRYAVRAATGGWVTAGLDGNLSPGGVDLELRPDGTPLIAYANLGGRLRVAEASAGGFILRTVDDSVLNQQAVSLVLSGTGLGVFFKDANDSTVKLASAATPAGPWTLSAVEALGAGDPYLSGVLDGAGKPHLVYAQPSAPASQTGGGDIRYVPLGTPGAAPELVDRAGGIGSNGQHFSVFIDTAGTVLASYIDSASGPVKVSSITGSRATPPASVLPPGGFTATAVHQTSATWGWDDRHPSEVGYRVYGGTEAPFAVVAATTTLGPGSAFFIETGLTPNTTYFRYAAVVTGGGAAVSLGTVSVTRAAIPVTAASTWTAVLAGSRGLGFLEQPGGHALRGGPVERDPPQLESGQLDRLHGPHRDAGGLVRAARSEHNLLPGRPGGLPCRVGHRFHVVGLHPYPRGRPPALHSHLHGRLADLDDGAVVLGDEPRLDRVPGRRRHLGGLRRAALVDLLGGVHLDDRGGSDEEHDVLGARPGPQPGRRDDRVPRLGSHVDLGEFPRGRRRAVPHGRPVFDVRSLGHGGKSFMDALRGRRLHPQLDPRRQRRRGPGRDHRPLGGPADGSPCQRHAPPLRPGAQLERDSERLGGPGSDRHPHRDARDGPL